MAQTLTARWVFPVSGPPLENGTVAIAGDRIAAVSHRGARAADLDLGNVALIPGLVNAHTHLDLSGARGAIPPTDPDHFTDWLKGVIAFRRTRDAEQTRADTRAGLSEALRFGTTLLGDISADGSSWEALAGAPVRAVVFREFIGLSDERSRQAGFELVKWKEQRSTPACRPGVSPHAPYSASGALIQAACRSGQPVTVHWAESPAELQLLAHRTGPFVEFLTGLGVWHPQNLTDSPGDTLAHASLHAPHLLLAHANYHPADGPMRANTTVVYCPRTHAAFGHPPHPFRAFLARGVRACLGTDSLASNPDLDILAEARFVRRLCPDFPGEQLVRMVTLSGAEALGWADEVGSLEAGKSADIVAVPLPDADAADPYELLLADHPGSRRTMFRGAWRPAA